MSHLFFFDADTSIFGYTFFQYDFSIFFLLCILLFYEFELLSDSALLEELDLQVSDLETTVLLFEAQRGSVRALVLFAQVYPSHNLMSPSSLIHR